MTELPALPRCKVNKKGRHDLSYIIPAEAGDDVTVICDACGITRRFPASGTLHSERLDDLSADEIISLVTRASEA